MSKIRTLLTLLVVSICSVHSAWADVEINETNFPDYNFRNYLLGWGYGSDGVITDEEISNIKNFYIGGRYIRNLKGIEYFTALTFLQCDNNQLTSLDLSQNKALTNLQCGNNQLTSLDLSSFDTSNVTNMGECFLDVHH